MSTREGVPITQPVSASTGLVGTGARICFLDGTTHPWDIQQCSRCSIPTVQQLFRMGSTPGYFQPSCETILSSKSGPFCHTSQPSSSPICVTLPRPGSHGNRCLCLQLEPVEELDIPTSGPAAQNPQEDSDRPSNSTDFGPTLEGSTMVKHGQPWKSWSSWCSERSLCPFTAPGNSVFTFLAELAHQGKLAIKKNDRCLQMCHFTNP